MSFLEHKSIRLCRLFSGLLMCITLLFPLKPFGAEPTAPQTPASAAQHSDSLAVIDVPRDYLSGQIASFANEIDRFFGGDRHYQESNQSVVQIDLTRVTGYGGDGKYDLAARVNLKMPATEGRLHLLLESDPENNITDEQTQNSTLLNNQVTTPGSYGLAARYVKQLEDIWHFSFDWGIKFPIPPHPFVRTRGSYSIPLGDVWRLKAAESIYWFNNLGLGETTQLDFERFLSKPVLFRATSTVTWLKDKQNFNLRQDLSVYHTLSDRTALLSQTSAIGVSNPQYELTDFVLSVLYRYRLHRDWMFFEFSPQLHFPKEENFRSSPTLSLRLEMLFDDTK
jgi:hypothetical protein